MTANLASITDLASVALTITLEAYNADGLATKKDQAQESLWLQMQRHVYPGMESCI